jgi:hypothetical protein
MSVGISGAATLGLYVASASLIEAGLTQEWSNGVTEDQIHRLKPVKRRGYGRAGFALLRQRILQAAYGHRGGGLLGRVYGGSIHSRPRRVTWRATKMSSMSRIPWGVMPIVC